MSSDTKTIETPVTLAYTYVAGRVRSRFLAGLAQGVIIGFRCPKCGFVYVNSRGTCPADGVTLVDEVEMSDHGTLLSWCRVNVPYHDQKIKIPYVCGMVQIDGTDSWIMHLIDGGDSTEIRSGMRLRARWVPKDELGPTLESIQCFEAVNEPVIEDVWQRHLDGLGI